MRKYPTVEKVLADWADENTSEKDHHNRTFEAEVDEVQKELTEFSKKLRGMGWNHLNIHEPQFEKDGMGSLVLKLLLS